MGPAPMIGQMIMIDGQAVVEALNDKKRWCVQSSKRLKSLQDHKMLHFFGDEA